MNRPRNRQPRSPRENNNRGNFSNRSPRPRVSNNVPTTQQVKPGASVSIVLKADQSTGREVQGVVQDLLTRGDHPHGIKVRLQDGRVGRVQRMLSGATEITTSRSAAPTTTVTSKRSLVDHEPRQNPSPAATNLGHFMTSPVERSHPSTPSVVARCPICDVFEGDEIAVSHHVQQHLNEEIESPG